VPSPGFDDQTEFDDPTITVAITSPTGNLVLTGQGPGIIVTGTAHVDGGGHLSPVPQVDHVDVRFGEDGAWLRATGTATWSVTGDVPGNGTLRIDATATGSNDLTGTTSVVVVCQLTDATPPVVTITAPAANSTVSGDGTSLRLPVAVEVADDFLGISSITWSVEGISRAYESFATPLRSWSGTRTIELDASTRTSRTISVTAADAAGNTGSRDVTVAVTDITAPALRVLQPQDGARLPGTGIAQTITIRGTATDLESGVGSVEVSLDGASFAAVTSRVDWEGVWETTLTALPGRHTAAVRSTDEAGNMRAITVRFEVAQPHTPTDALDLFSRHAYLADLLWFADTHVLDGSGQPLTAAALTEAFRQPFAQLADPLQPSASAPVTQVRAAIEVLRRFLESPEAGLVAHFRFDESTGTTTGDSTAGGAAAAVQGAAWTEGRAGTAALLFDGVSDAVLVRSGERLREITNRFTIAFWALPLSPRQTDTASTMGVSGTAGQRYAFGPQQGGIAFGSPDHAGVGISVGTNGVSVYEHSDGYLPAALVHDIPLAGWTHIAVTYEWQQKDLMSGTPEGWYPVLYLDGVPVTTGRVSPKSFLHCVPEDLGASSSGYGAFHGRLEDVRIYDRTLPPSRVMTLAKEREHAVAADHAFLAYRMLLNRIGTSFDEIRLARGSDAAFRCALAERLGIDLVPARPDQLDRLLVTPTQASEEVVEELFGMADTTRDPFGPMDAPLLQRWREARQRRLWAEADHPQPARDDTSLVVDPDLLVAADIRHRVAGDPAFDLWTARRQWTDAAFAAIRASRERLGPVPPADAFDTVVGDIVGVPVARLVDLDRDRRRGISIEADLAALRLIPAELLQLLRAREVAGSGIVTDDEWQDLYHLLTQVRKHQQRVAWLQAEAGVALTPDSFVLSTAAWTPVPWRAAATDRANWRDRLQARIDQQAVLRAALQEAVGEVEQAALPRLRDGLISLLGTTSWEADQLTELLLVDFNGGGTGQTTRVEQAIETLQQLVLGMRSGRLPQPHPARTWTVEPGSVAGFDDEWTWMGSYDAWRAAIFVFTFPEDLLAPTLRDGGPATPATAKPTAAFQALVTQLRGQQRLRRDVAVTAANDVLAAIRPLLENFPVRTVPPAGQDIRDGLLAFHYTDRPTGENLTQLQSLSTAALTHLGVNHPNLPNYLQELFYYVPLLLAQNLQRSGDYVAALDWYRAIYAYDQTDLPDVFMPFDERKIYYGLQLENNTPALLSRGIHWLREELNPHTLAGQRPNPYTRYTFASIARCFLEYGDSEFTRDTGESRAKARALYLTALGLLRSPEMEPPSSGGGIPLGGAAALPSPVLTTLVNRVENQLRKLRQGRNIAGMRRQIEAPTTTPAVSSGMPAVGSGGQPVLPALTPPRPTPYLFSVLLERSRHLAGMAAQLEASYLNALEKRDAGSYDLLKAGLDLDLARAGEHLHTLRVAEAQKGTELARRQKTTGDLRKATYQQWIDHGANQWEQNLVRNYDDARVYRDWISGLDAGITAAQALASASGYGYIAATAVSALAAGRAVNALKLNRTEEDIQLNSLRASQERRQDEWELQLALATQDGLVAEEAILVALDHEDVVGQDARIAGLQAFEAQSVADFLARKFLNAELYEWMSGVLAGVYGYFLQQATSTALLAQSQLSFERQQIPPAYIQADYWRAPAEVAGAAGGTGGAGRVTAPQDRRGLTGSARLLQDIEQLAQFAFENDRRKLNLTQTFSLAQLAPFEFQQFRETGVLTFVTPMSLFDRAFPGHYLRLIKRIRTSLIALVSPVSGIHATLTSSGVSRVVTGPEMFEEVVIRRDPESVSLTSPVNASGVFDLDVQSEMLLPFESTGVASTWEFQLPQAANPFDYRSIADLLLTLEYTALSDADYRTQVIQTLNPRVTADRSYSFRESFPDAWYDLNNPEQSAAPMTARFETRPEDFPPNLESGSARIDQLLLYISQKPGTEQPVLVQQLTLTPPGADQPIPTSGSTAAQSTVEGLISTRAGNWNWLGGAASPVPVAGTWKLTFAANLAERFSRGEIEDILFVITYSARTPPWPDA